MLPAGLEVLKRAINSSQWFSRLANVNSAQQFYEFGPFRIDPDHRRLLRGSEPVPLQPKAFDILLTLVQNRERVVSKDDLLKTVWPDTFVEESNLSQHVFVLRRILGDSTDKKGYIHTVPGRGYRFVETVRVVGAEEAEKKSERETTEDNEEQLVLASRSLSTVTIERDKASLLRSWIAIGAMLAAIAVAVALYWRSRPKPNLTDKDTIVVAEFTNTTGDSVFDGSLRQGLAAQLAQSPFLNLLSDSRAAQTLALMGRPNDAPLTPELAQEVCQRTQSAAALDGAIAQIGTRYLLTLKAVACSNGDSMASTEAEASDKNHVLHALGRIASEIRPKLGESLASVQKYDVPVLEVTTGSLEALRAYALARGDAQLNRLYDSIPLYQRAISIDPNFAAAYQGLSVIYFNQDETALAAENAKKAYGLRGHVSEYERLSIEMLYEFAVTRNFEAARKSALLYTQIHPRDFSGYTNLAVACGYLGDNEGELTANQKALELNPGIKSTYTNLITSYLHQNQTKEAEVVAADAASHNLDSNYIHELLYLVNFLKHDNAGMKREEGKSDSDLLRYLESDTAAYDGQFAKARGLTEQAADKALRAGQKETAAEYKAEGAVREALAGNTAQAKRQAKDALALSTAKEIVAASAIALGLAGDPEASRLGEDLGKRSSEDTALNYNLLPEARAAIALHSGNLAKAISALAVSSPYELGATMQEADFWLYSVYLRGEEYLAAKQGAAAAAEFQKIVDHPGLVVNEPIGALAHLELGRACALSHDPTAARTEYQTFLTLWKDADPDIPILKEAKTEYAKLQ